MGVRRLVIAAACARPFVRAAAAVGYEVVAADVFCDADTRRHAAQAVQLDYRDGGFVADEVRRKLLPLLRAGRAAFVYGSGFETQPELLEEIAQCCPVLGNTAETVRVCKDPGRFFSLLRNLDLPFPQVSLTRPQSIDGWLSKRIGGSGGTHVQHAGTRVTEDRYYQRNQPGQPVSLLFAADGSRVRSIGCNTQVIAPLPELPFRYGGAVSQAELPESVRSGMLAAAQRITSTLGLRGLNSLDCLVDGDGFSVLEVNPRLSATFALYDAAASGANLFLSHLRACAGELVPPLPDEHAQAHLIYYAPFSITIPAAFHWPEWVSDIPIDHTRVNAGEPLCTVMAAAESADDARALALARVNQLNNRINITAGN